VDQLQSPDGRKLVEGIWVTRVDLDSTLEHLPGVLIGFELFQDEPSVE
jgi:hypothetical protein